MRVTPVGQSLNMFENMPFLYFTLKIQNKTFIIHQGLCKQSRILFITFQLTAAH